MSGVTFIHNSKIHELLIFINKFIKYSSCNTTKTIAVSKSDFDLLFKQIYSENKEKYKEKIPYEGYNIVRYQTKIKRKVY